MKKILDVPKTTPTPAIWFITGILTTSILIDKRQLLYLKTLLDKPEQDWYKKMLFCLEKDDIGWPKQINQKLEEYELDYSWEQIKNMKYASWKRIVTLATEKKNTKKLIDMCYDGKGEKRKTKNIIEILNDKNYVRKPRM